VDINWIRELHGMNGLAELAVENGVLSDPSANYTSSGPLIVHCLAETLSQSTLLPALLASPTLSFSTDESRGVDNHAYMLLYLRYITHLGTPEEAFVASLRMTLDIPKVKEFARDLDPAFDENKYPITLKGGLNMAFLVVDYFRTHFDGKISFADISSAAIDGTGSNFGPEKGLRRWLDLVRAKLKKPKLLATHCFAHQLALTAKHASESVDYLDRIFEPTWLKVWIYYEYSSVRKDRLEKVFQQIEAMAVPISHASFTRWLTRYTSAVKMKKGLAAVVMEMVASAASGT
jgi:hypothetical protein